MTLIFLRLALTEIASQITKPTIKKCLVINPMMCHEKSNNPNSKIKTLLLHYLCVVLMNFKTVFFPASLILSLEFSLL